MFVLQEWVSGVGMKMQSILLSGLRAPDTKTSAVEKIVRWMRSCCQIDADPQKQSYMQTIEITNSLIEEAIGECEYLQVHYLHHLADALRVIAIQHPNMTFRFNALTIHNLIATELFHFHPETKMEFLERHKDCLLEPGAKTMMPCNACEESHGGRRKGITRGNHERR